MYFMSLTSSLAIYNFQVIYHVHAKAEENTCEGLGFSTIVV